MTVLWWRARGIRVRTERLPDLPESARGKRYGAVGRKNLEWLREGLLFAYNVLGQYHPDYTSSSPIGWH